MADRGIKQSAVAEKVGMTPQTLSATLLGKRKMGADEFFDICRALEANPNLFFKATA
jgi:transcriptional regulator with XRE-family HTH domain